MAATANPSPRNPAGGGGGGDSLNSQQSKRGAAARGVPSPWMQVVRGGADSELIVSSSAPSSPLASVCASAQGHISNCTSDDYAVDDNGSGSSNAAKKPAWNKPSNGVVEVGPVMGADLWPALSKNRASPKSCSSDSMKDGSVLVSQGTGIASSPPPLSSANPSLAPNHVTLTSQISMKRSAGSTSRSVTVNGVLSQPVSPPALGVEIPSSNAGKPGSSVPETSSRDHTHKDDGQKGGFGLQSHGGNDQIQQRNSYRRGNATTHPRGDGSFHHNYGGRREQDRGNHGRNTHRSFNGRDAHVQPQRVGPRGFMGPPPHSSAAFIPPPAMVMRSFGNPMIYPEAVAPMMYVQAAPPPDSLRGLPIGTPIPPHAMFYPVPDPQLPTKMVNQIDYPVPDLQLPTKIVNQIEYYFSNDNLIKDQFLRENMDKDGWVPIKLIARFNKVVDLTTDIDLILDVMSPSNVVEVHKEEGTLGPKGAMVSSKSSKTSRYVNGKLRKRNDWRRWIISPSVQFPTVPSPQSLGKSSHEAFAAEIQSLSLEDQANKQGRDEAFLYRSLSGEGTSQAALQAGTDHSILATSST